MRSAISQTLQLLNRRSRSGQSIIIIALGFIGLVAFVGIATDTAVLFVRYSSLHRAVDAAAIAAAGAARQSSNFGSLGAVAEEYIKIHGIDPTSVRVDDCATEIADYITAHGGTPANALGQLLLSPTEQLCTDPKKPEKLVRVEAQIDSQTTFLSLIGFPTVRLSASSVSQTASLDVALLIDASASESYDTKGGFGDLTTQQGIICQFAADANCNTGSYTTAQSQTVSDQLDQFESLRGYFGDQIDPYDPNNPSGKIKFPTATSHLNGSIRAECRQIADYNGSLSYDPTQNPPHPVPIAPAYSQLNANYYYGGCCDEPVTFTNPTSPPDENWYIYSDPNLPAPAVYNTFNVAHLYSGQSPTDTGNPVTGGGYQNRNYSTLICKPFKYVRDAARDFLNHFDFSGGDRAMLITFDDTVHELTSNGEYNNPSDASAIGGAIPVFSSKSDAIIALNKYAGVQISPLGYHASCLAEYWPPYNWNGRYRSDNSPVPDTGKTLVYETTATCPDTNTGGAILAGQGLLTNASWIRRDSVWVMVILSDGFPNRTPGLSGLPCTGTINCNPAIGGGQSASIHKINEPTTDPYYTTIYGDSNYNGLHGGKFFGDPNFPYPPTTTTWDNSRQQISALTQESLTDPGFCPWNTFCDPTGGGTASYQTKVYPPIADDPHLPYFYQNGDLYPDPSNNLNKPGVPDATHNMPDLVGDSSAAYYNGNYCSSNDSQPNPIWWSVDSKNPSLPYYSNENDLGNDKVLCTSTNPDARHFCMNPTTGVIDPVTSPSSTPPNPSDPTLCSKNYDSADYARDQVDFAALTDYTSTVKGNSVAMYGIFFPHQTASTNGDIAQYILGAKFMRYVADAGDNGTIDNHLQAWYRLAITDPTHNPYNPDPNPPNGYNPTNYPGGPEDPCAAYDYDVLGAVPGSHTIPSGIYYQGEGYEDLYKYNCGNYYYAGSTAAIDQAFLSIASRLYTRLAH